MGSVIVDVITRGLDEAIINVGKLPELITLGSASQLESWYNKHYKKTVLEVIETGRPMSLIPPNEGKYREWKEREYPSEASHGLGWLTGRLYGAVAVAQCRITQTRGKEVRFSVVYKEPFYISFVHEGFIAGGKAEGVEVKPRPFTEVARDKELPKLIKMMGDMFDGLDFTKPYPELVSSVIGMKR